MRSKLLMIIAIVAIGAGLAGIFLSGGNTPTPPPSVVKAPEPKPVVFKVYQVKKQLRQGEHVHRADLEIIRLPEADAQKQGIDADSLFSLDEHAVYRKDLSRGQLLLHTDIVMPDDPEFIALTIAPGHIPFAIEVDPSSVVGGIIRPGSYVDVLALTGLKTRSSELGHDPDRNVTINPVLSHIRVLKMEQSESKAAGRDITQHHLILEVTRKQVAQLTIAKQIAQLEVYTSAGSSSAKDLKANAGDVLPDFKAVKELRADKIIVK